MKRKIAVTGATGFIGSHLIEELSYKYDIKCLVRDKSKSILLKKRKCRLVTGDIRRKKELKNLINGSEVIYHIAGQVNVSEAIKNPIPTFNVNTLGTLNLLEMLRRYNDSCLIVFLSSDRVYGEPDLDTVDENTVTNPTEPYSTSKLCAENLIQAYNKAYSIPYVIIRGSNVYGPSQKKKLFIPSVINQIISGSKILRVGNLDSYRNFVYISDMVDALHRILLKKKARNEIINISGEGMRMSEILDVILLLAEKYLKRRIEVIQDPSKFRPSEVKKEYVIDCSKARRILGWEPEFNLRKGLEKTFKSALEGGFSHAE